MAGRPEAKEMPKSENISRHSPEARCKMGVGL